jgi:hypothetical protein
MHRPKEKGQRATKSLGVISSSIREGGSAVSLYNICMLLVLALRGCYSMEEEYCKRRKVDRAY